jgi:hypothetical protein
MNDTVQTLIRDILRETGDTSARNTSKEMILRHITREAAYVAARYPNVLRIEGSPASGPTHEVSLWDLTNPIPQAQVVVKDIWVNGEALQHVHADDLEGVIE